MWLKYVGAVGVCGLSVQVKNVGGWSVRVRYVHAVGEVSG